ncbi:MAG TPA: hypothetical protein DCZ86_05905 [Candidatus Moranbacteria bacterium]|uniref:Uncharacterized protein n=1 Tax=Candidatus Tagabacteria bacterium RIFCSPLOWO2_01_FULL_42_9 TaxID=1802296 RepID=A0A1G2LY94_9BACT|nr:MAG: hypothetical protein A3A10_00720 [Candidatus Tagabacteria bacterium RIFCSPLOWO2_01_FULL_42_9]HBB37497.1 hypothetical protein [Candidatus Moranbacteria bacterium]
MKTTEIAASFVDLALKHDWSKIKELSADEAQILFTTISAAGFEPTKVVPGKLVGHYRDQDGSSTGETYPINGYCPYKVINRDGDDHYHATGWLEGALSFAMRGVINRQESIKVIQHEIERSVPLKPIQLTVDGDFLREYPSSRGYFVDHTRDDREFGSCVGIHDFCNSWMDFMRVTKTHNAIVCRGCHLRVLFPKEIKTYGELRQILASKIAQVPA